MKQGHAALQSVAFFIIFFFVALAAEILLFLLLGAIFNARIIPRGLGWVMFPILAGIAGGALGKNVGIRGLLEGAQAQFFLVADKKMRGLAAASGLWAALICTIFLVFDPFHSYRWHQEEWTQFFFVLLGPPAFGFMALRLFDWALKDRINVVGAPPLPSRPKYRPARAVFEMILWSLIAVYAVSERSKEPKKNWIVLLGNEIGEERLDREMIDSLVGRLDEASPSKMIDVLRAGRSEMNIQDREFLIKSCCLLASVAGAMSQSERELILSFAEALEIGEDRLWML